MNVLLAALCFHSAASAWPAADLAIADDETVLLQVGADVMTHRRIDQERLREMTESQDTILLQNQIDAASWANSIDVLGHIEFPVRAVEIVPLKNKLILILFEAFFFLAFFGADRCYMGDVCLGVIKGLTLGGLGVWGCFDWAIVVLNCLNKSESIDTMGFKANFGKQNIDASFWIAVVMLVLLGIKVLVLCCFGTVHVTMRQQNTNVETDAGGQPFVSQTQQEAKYDFHGAGGNQHAQDVRATQGIDPRAVEVD